MNCHEWMRNKSLLNHKKDQYILFILCLPCIHRYNLFSPQSSFIFFATFFLSYLLSPQITSFFCNFLSVISILPSDKLQIVCSFLPGWATGDVFPPCIHMFPGRYQISLSTSVDEIVGIRQRLQLDQVE